MEAKKKPQKPLFLSTKIQNFTRKSNQKNNSNFPFNRNLGKYKNWAWKGIRTRTKNRSKNTPNQNQKNKTKQKKEREPGGSRSEKGKTNRNGGEEANCGKCEATHLLVMVEEDCRHSLNLFRFDFYDDDWNFFFWGQDLLDFHKKLWNFYQSFNLYYILFIFVGGGRGFC